MVATDPGGLADRLATLCPPENVHSVVLWTKNADNILHHPALAAQLRRYDQLFIHYSITGLGATILEPGVPPVEMAFSHLAPLIDMTGDPRRLCVRFDPIVHFLLPEGREITNLGFFSPLAEELARHRIENAVTSWVQIYGKVARRLQRHGITPLTVEPEQRIRQGKALQKIARDHGIDLRGCCVPGWPVSHCIDGAFLNQLHPRGYRASEKRARGQRPLCGCTESWDIGWYYTCTGGCLYCYGRPRESATC